MAELVLRKNEQRVIPVLWTGRETELEQVIYLNAPGASVTVRALFLGKQSDQLQSRMHIIHAAPQTTSNLIVHATLDDAAKLDFSGLVSIQSGAKGTTAWLAAHILLLSKTAKGQATPSLEILENDVKAGHATTVGRVRSNELLYLMSRGLDAGQAKRLIVEGFVERMLQEFPEALAEQARQGLA